MFSPQLSSFLFALASIPTYVYRVSLEGSKRSSGGKDYYATSWSSWYRPGSEKCALALPLCTAAQQAATLDARRRKWKFLYWRGALTSKYPVPSGPRDTKALTFRQYLFNRFFSIYFHLNTKVSVLQPKSERKELIAQLLTEQ